MIQSIENYYFLFQSESDLQEKSLICFIDFIIINELRFVNIYELHIIIKCFAEHNPQDTVADLVFENYLYGDVQNRLKLINFHIFFDELENLIEIKDKFIDEIKYSSNPEKVFIQKDSEYNLDNLYSQLEFLSLNVSKYSFKKYFLHSDYSKLLKNKESAIKIKLAKEILKFNSTINLEQLTKRLLYIVLLEINSRDEPINEITFAGRYEQILSNQTKALIKIEMSAEDWFKEFRKRMTKEFSDNYLEHQKLIAKQTTIKVLEEQINLFGYDLLFDIVSLSKFDNILHIQQNHNYLQLQQNNPVESNTKDYVFENCDSPFCYEELRDFVEKQINDSLMLINCID